MKNSKIIVLNTIDLVEVSLHIFLVIILLLMYTTYSFDNLFIFKSINLTTYVNLFRFKSQNLTFFIPLLVV